MWLNIKNQLYPATVTSATANDVAFATEYGEVNLIIEIIDRKFRIERIEDRIIGMGPTEK